MKESSLYRDVANIPLSTTSHSHLGEVPVPSIRLERLAPVIQDAGAMGIIEDAATIDTNDSDIAFVQVSENHRRSYEVQHTELEKTYWTDEYGNVFGTLTTKGNNLSYLHAFRNPVTPSGFLVFGLQDSNSMQRVLNASEQLRSNGIPSEMILNVSEIQNIPVNGKEMSLGEFKNHLVNEVWIQNAEEGEVDEVAHLTKIERKSIRSLQRTLKNTTFYTTIRGMQTAERCEDLENVKDRDEFRKIMENVFAYINNFELHQAKQDPEYTAHIFDVDSPEDISNYISYYLPTQAARNFARMHNIGVVHHFPHVGNISAVGSFYDLDSVRGKPISEHDKEVTEEAKKHDIEVFMFGVDDGSSDEGMAGVLTRLLKNKIITHDDLCHFQRTFIDEYIATRGWTAEEVLKSFDLIYTLYDEFGMPDDPERALGYVNKAIGYDFQVQIEKDDYLDKFYTAYEQYMKEGIRWIDHTHDAESGAFEDLVRERLEKYKFEYQDWVSTYAFEFLAEYMHVHHSTELDEWTESAGIQNVNSLMRAMEMYVYDLVSKSIVDPSSDEIKENVFRIISDIDENVYSILSDSSLDYETREAPVDNSRYDSWQEKRDAKYENIDHHLELIKLLWNESRSLPIPGNEDPDDTYDLEFESFKEKLWEKVKDILPITAQKYELMQDIAVMHGTAEDPTMRSSLREAHINDLKNLHQELSHDTDVQITQIIESAFHIGLMKRRLIRKIFAELGDRALDPDAYNDYLKGSDYMDFIGNIVEVIPDRFSIHLVIDRTTFNEYNAEVDPFSNIKGIHPVRGIFSFIKQPHLDENGTAKNPAEFREVLDHEDFHSLSEAAFTAAANRHERIGRLIEIFEDIESKEEMDVDKRREMLQRLQQVINLTAAEMFHDELLAELASKPDRISIPDSTYASIGVRERKEVLETLNGRDPEIDKIIASEVNKLDTDIERLKATITDLYSEVEAYVPEKKTDLDVAFAYFSPSNIRHLKRVVKNWVQKKQSRLPQ